MPSAAPKPQDPAPDGLDLAFVDELNSATVAAIATAPMAALEPEIRKWLRADHGLADDELRRIFPLAYSLAASLHLFTPSLSGARPIDRLARAARKSEERALKALAGSKFAILLFESLGADRRGFARDCVTGEVYRVVTEGLADVLTAQEVATRLCPIGGGLFWPMGPFVPFGPPGAAKASAFPTRPGKGLINTGAVAAQIYRKYLRMGAPLGIDFGIAENPGVMLPPLDDALRDYADSMRGANDPTPRGETLARLRSLASPPRVAMALTRAQALVARDHHADAGIFYAAARVMLDVLLERRRVGSNFASGTVGLRQEIEAYFAPEPIPEGVNALLKALLAEAGAASPGGEAVDENLARVIERIRALRRKTVEMGCTEQEALGAAEKVAELLERYGLSLTEIEMRRQTCEGFGFDTGRKQSGPIDECFMAVAHFCDCRMWTETAADGGLRHVFFGLPADVEAAHCLKDLVVAAFDVETGAFKTGRLYGQEAAASRRAMVKSFQIGLGSGVSRKLVALKQAREKATAKSTGRDLALVKRSIVDEELEKLGLSFRSKAKRRIQVIADAYEHGVKASQRFEVNEKIG